MSVYDGEKGDAWRDYVLYGGLPLVLGFQTPDQNIGVGLFHSNKKGNIIYYWNNITEPAIIFQVDNTEKEQNYERYKTTES